MGSGESVLAAPPGHQESTWVWRVPQPVRRFAVVIFYWFIAVAALVTAIGLPLWGVLAAWSMALLVSVCIWRWYLIPYVELQPDRLVVQGPFALRSVRYGAIHRASPGVLGLRIDTSEGSITAWAIQKSKLADWLDRETPADDLAAQIMRRVDHAA